MRLWLLCTLLLPVAACDSSKTVGEVPPDPPGLPQAVARDKAELSSSVASSFTLSLAENGTAQSAQGISSGFNQYNPYLLYSAGLWVSGTQGGSLRTAVTRSLAATFAPCGDGTGGVFHLFADTTYSAEGWPVTRGAPVDPSGAPRVYGDEMLWATTCQSPSGQQFSDLTRFDGLRTNVALFRHASTPNMVFARYEMVNTSASAMTDVSVGTFADTDLNATSQAREDVYDNLIGLDVVRELAYVYIDQIKTLSPGVRRTDAERGHVAGVTLLETPRRIGLTGHRITRKYAPYLEPSASEPLLYSRALQTLLNDGSAQVNWTTGLPDKLAYTGDPVAMTGWLDGTGPLKNGGGSPDVQDGADARILLSSGTFSLAPNERVTLTVAWATADGPNLGAALGALQQRVSSVRASSALWQF